MSQSGVLVLTFGECCFYRAGEILSPARLPIFKRKGIHMEPNEMEKRLIFQDGNRNWNVRASSDMSSI